jgi:hypothetical protein
VDSEAAERLYLGREREADVMGWTHGGEYINCWNKLYFRDENIFTPAPITLYNII